MEQTNSIVDSGYQDSGYDDIDCPLITDSKQRKAAFFKFVGFSFIGILFFMTPLYWDGQWTIGIGILANALKAEIIDGKGFQIAATVAITASAVLSLIMVILKPKALNYFPNLKLLLQPNLLGLTMRVVGAIFVTMIFFQVGPAWIISNTTGGVILNDLNPPLVSFLIFAVLILPFLVDYGLMEFVGVYLSKPFQKVFGLPGRSVVDALASWLGSASVGVLITSQQYDRGFYSAREASVISTNFSIASIAFTLIIVQFIGISHLFLQFYGVLIVTGLVLAIIVPRLPPLNNIPDSYFIKGVSQPERIPEGVSLKKWAIEQAMVKSHYAPTVFQSLRSGSMVLLDIYLGLMPVVFAVATVALAIAEYTSIFSYLSYPFIYFLEILNVPEAVSAAPAMLVGFADMFLPAVLAQGIANEQTQFIIACISMAQVIYLTEVAALILRSNIPLNLFHLFAVFLWRTVIGLPIVVFMTKFFVF